MADLSSDRAPARGRTTVRIVATAALVAVLGAGAYGTVEAAQRHDAPATVSLPDGQWNNTIGSTPTIG